jgi:phosphoglycerate dehydrogenase-like enzyme
VSGGARRLVVDLASTSRNWSLPAWGAERIRAAAPPGWEVHVATSSTSSDGDGSGGTAPEVLEAAGDAEVYFGFGLSEALFAAAPRLRWVHSASAGVGSLLFPAMRASDVLLTNSAGVMADPIAEHILGGVIFLLRAMDVAVEQQRRREWNKAPFVAEGATVREVGECRILVVGAGGIGTAVARRFSAMGARCTGVRRRPELGAPDGFERVVAPDGLEEALREADVLVLCAPLTEGTRGLLDGRRLDCLPTGAIVVNVARGSLLDEEALVERVRSGRLRGAVLDVFRQEPLPAESPLWGLPQVLLTPHVAAVSPRRFWERELELFLGNWSRYQSGAPLANLVDKDAGY